MEPKKYNIFKINLSKDQIMTFVGGLHELQEEMIEASVKQKERQGFPEATKVIEHIKGLK